MEDPCFEVFISSASQDYPFATEIYTMLTEAGIRCFFSDQSIDTVGQAEYKRVIDGALEQCRHLVHVTSCRVNSEKEWVRYEWDTFAIERLSGRKQGNLITLACGIVTAAELPLTIRQNQVLRWPAEASRLLPYVGKREGAFVEATSSAIPWPQSQFSPTAPPQPAQRPLDLRLLARIGKMFWRGPIWPAARGGRVVWDFFLRLVRLTIFIYALIGTFVLFFGPPSMYFEARVLIGAASLLGLCLIWFSCGIKSRW